MQAALCFIPVPCYSIILRPPKLSMPMPTDSPETSAAAPPPSTTARWIGRAGNVLIFGVSIVATLLIAEIGFRVVTGVPVLELTDWRQEGARTNRIGERATTDPLLGWTLAPHYQGSGFTTLDYGFRRNFGETEVRIGGILAVGDSFTEGFDEVDDANTWPAHLEKITGTPVINAGVAGFATDQVILRAEQTLPIVKPKTLILGFTEVDVYRAALSQAGAPKPYFTAENGQLAYHPPGPLENNVKEGIISNALRSVLGYSALSDHLFSRLTPSFWYPSEASTYEEVEIDPVDITCKLLARLKQRTDDAQVRLLLLLQYSGELVLEEPYILNDMKKITECSQQVGIQVVDQFASLKALTHYDPDLVAQYYTLEGEEFGHMTPLGNEHAAQLLAAAMKETAATPPQSSELPEQQVQRN